MVLNRKEIPLIDRDELIEVLARSDVSTREKIAEIVQKQPVVAVAVQRYEIYVTS
jgi:hypothetical protein